MPKSIPIYRAHDETYRADSCRPLVRAADLGRVQLEALRQGHYPGRVLPRGRLSGVKMVGFWDAADDQEWGLSWHRNEGIEFTLLERGALNFAVDGAEYDLEPGDLTITRPWQLHRVGNPTVTASRLNWYIVDLGLRRPHQPWKWPPWILLSKSELDELTDILRHNEQHVWKATPQLLQCFREVARAVETDREGDNVTRLKLLLNEAMLILREMLRAKDVKLDRSLSSSRRTVQLFLDDLRANPEHLEYKWSLEEMADSCKLATTQFVHHVKSLTNVSPVHYLTNCRLEYAANLLKDKPEASVTEVALTCGFSSGQYFATVFHRRFGCSPREHRQG